MKPTLDQLSHMCPGIDPAFLQAHLSRLSNRYFERFDLPQLSRHVTSLAQLSATQLVDVQIDQLSAREVGITVCAFDYSYEFSLITGILAGMGFNIATGEIFTYAPAPPAAVRRRSRRHAPGLKPDLVSRRRIVDYFAGQVTSQLPFDFWCRELSRVLNEIILLLEQNDSASVSRARHKVNDLVAASLSDLNISAESMLFPIELHIDNDEGPFTHLSVIAQDTPLFLYSLTNALALQQLRIEQVAIRTHARNVEDDIYVVDSQGSKLTDPDRLNELKLCVLLTKQFTYFLANAPNPYSALLRFEQLVETVIKAPSRGQWIDVLASPHAMHDLARMLGTSDFIWEDFIRAQYESLLPLLAPHVGQRHASVTLDTLEQRLLQELSSAASFEEKRDRLNAFKDREIFLIDLDHIVDKALDFREFAQHLTRVAECVITVAADCVYQHLTSRYGIPRTAAGVEAEHAVLGLGKFGGVALGYASDIELMFVYSDNGQTDGHESLDNGEFFHLFAQELTRFIQAKQEGIFHIDLRLRPFGNASPLASSLENFCRYYGPGGQAHSYEKLSLVRLRAVAGSPALGARIERLRDELVYAAKSIDLDELRTLRQKQFKEKTRAGGVNAKFSPGGLVDLEYDVQILQVIHGHSFPALRTPRIHTALEALAAAGVLNKQEAQQLSEAYSFLRRLINALRMLRGSAKDLFLPGIDDDEYSHLARRMGYTRGSTMSPAQNLYVDFETQTAIVRAFVERHFGRDSLPAPQTGTMADIILSDSLSEETRVSILTAMGFNHPARACVNLKNIAGFCGAKRFTTLAILAGDILRNKPDPDMALNNWERFINQLPDRPAHFNHLLAQPVRLDILLSVFSGSQFMADTLIRTPDFFEWITNPDHLYAKRSLSVLTTELLQEMPAWPDLDDWRAFLRMFRRREILRIGIRDMWLHVPLSETVRDISAVAEALTDIALHRCWHDIRTAIALDNDTDDPERHLCLLAFGKLGGSELNYSSDIDLLGVCDDCVFDVKRISGDQRSHKELYQQVLDHMRNDLTAHTADGYVYRVDFRLRPYGSAGELVPNVSTLITYYRSKASLWELQAALKLRPVAGNRVIGEYFLNMLRQVLLTRRNPDEVIASIRSMRDRSIQLSSVNSKDSIDIKSGQGGIRDIEFLVQGLQMIHAPVRPELLNSNTLDALALLGQYQILSADVVQSLEHDYCFLRQVEHYLQILEDRQIHALPRSETELTALARRILGIHTTAEEFTDQINTCLTRVRTHYQTFLENGFSK